MSHDRGCYKCGKDNWEYETCKEPDCPKYYLSSQLNSGIWEKASQSKYPPNLNPSTGNAYHQSTSSKIRNRLGNKRHFACDNISEFIEDGEMKELENELTDKFQGVLDTLIIDGNDPNSHDTPRRLAKMYLYEIFSGRYQPKPKATTFPNEDESAYNGMIVIRAELKSTCAHHLAPVKGVAYIGIIPNGRVLGLSKYIRIAQWVARRGTLQEQLCMDIAEEIKKASLSNDIAVYIAATHGCCELRGVMAHSSLTQTTVLKGQFNTPDVKLEFFDNIKMQEAHTSSR